MKPTVRDTYFAILKYKKEHDGNSPSLRDLMQMTGIASTNTVHLHLRTLEQEELIRVLDGEVRSIEVWGGRWTHDDIE